MNKYQAKQIMSKHIAPRPVATEWLGLTVQSPMGLGTVVEAFHNVNNGVTLRVKRANGSGYTFAHLVTVI